MRRFQRRSSGYGGFQIRTDAEGREPLGRDDWLMLGIAAILVLNVLSIGLMLAVVL